jgi:arylformamidase
VAGASTFLFLHGGAFREGDRAQYGYVAKSFVEQGILVAVATYQLTGEGFIDPDQVEDVKLAVSWLHQHIAHYGGDGMRIYVGGHSSGAILAADAPSGVAGGRLARHSGAGTTWFVTAHPQL